MTIHAINHKPKAVKIKVFDRYPYTKKDARVDVGGFKAEPEPRSVSSYNQVRWEQDLPPGKKSEITFSYNLAYRSNLAVSGQEGGGSW